MTEPKRCTIFIPSDGSLYERMDDPSGQWIFDPDHKIDLCNLTSSSSRAARCCVLCHNWDKNNGCALERER